jgi:histidinol-phosphate aminotransferase
MRDFSNINPYKPGKPIEEVKRALGLKEVYKLASNEIPFVPSYIKKAVLAEIENINRYPEGGSFYLRELIAKKHGVKPEQIVFGNGSDEVIALAITAAVAPGDEVIISHPTFLVYEIQALVRMACVTRVPFKNCKYDLEAMAAAVTEKTKIVIIANPDNPTGTYCTLNEIESFLGKIPKSVLVFFDEAYFEFAPKGFPDSLKILNRRGNIIFSRTFSKAFGLAGVRLGYGISTPEIAAVLNNIREPFNINRFAQVAAIAALRDKTFVKKVVAYNNKEKAYFYKELDRLKITYVKSATNFIMIDFKGDTTALNDYLLKNGVIIRELKGWGLPGFFRVTTGLHKENIKFIDCLKKYCCNGEKSK